MTIHELLEEGHRRHKRAVISYTKPAQHDVLTSNCICGYKWPCYTAQLIECVEVLLSQF